MAGKVVIEVEIDGTKSIDTMGKLNDEIKLQKQLLNDAKIGSEEYANARDAINNLTKTYKDLTTELTKEEKAREKHAAAMEKEAQKMQELIKAASMEVKSEEDMIKKKNALVALRKKVDQTTEEGARKYAEMAVEIKGLNDQLIKNDEAINMHQRKVGNYQAAVDTANLSLGEMKRELRELRNMSFTGLKPEEITQIRDRMAELTDAVGDFQAQINTASQDRIPALVDGLQGLVAVAQGVTGTLAIFGVETEKLDKAMVQLIGVSQALTTIQELQEKGTIRVALATAKDTIAKIANAVAAKGQAMATTGATAATRALGKAMMTNPYAAIAVAVAAVTAGVILLIRALNEEKSAMDGVIDNARKATGEYQAEQFAMNQMFDALKKTNVGSAERKKLTDEINELYKDYLPALLTEKSSLEEIDKAQKAANESLKANIFMKAKRQELESVESKLAELYTEQRKELDHLDKINKGVIGDEITKGDMIAETEGNLIKINNRIDEQEKLWQDITKYYDTQMPQQLNMTAEQQAALDAYNTALGLRNNQNKKGKTEADNFNKSMIAINREYELNIFFAKDRIAQFEAEKTKAQSLFDLYKNFYAEGGYTGDELIELEKLKNELIAISDLLTTIPLERAKGLQEVSTTVVDNINAEMQAWLDAENNKYQSTLEFNEAQEKANNNLIQATNKAREEQLNAEKEKWMQYSALASDAMGEVGGIIGDSIDEQGFNLENFSKKIILLGLDVLEKQALLAIASSTAQALAQPDSVATFGATGVARAAVLTGLIKAALSITKAAVSGFADGGFTGHGGKYEPAGTVHKGEVVFSQADVAALGGAQTVDAMRPTSKQNYYVGGIVGSVPQPVNSSAMLLDAIRQIRPIVTVQDINAVAQAESNRQQIAVI